MKVRKLLRDNVNAVVRINIFDGDDVYTMLSRSPALEKYKDRKVLYWSADGTVDMCMAGMSIYLKEAKHGQ